jgi:DNA-binding NarL/FixJ family response regulator
MATHFHAAVWIDHHEARIFHFNAFDADRSVVHPEHPTRHLHHKAGAIGSGHAAEDQEFLAHVEAAVADAGVILIAGPANAKSELIKHMQQHAPDIYAKVAAVETADHPTDRQFLDHARRYFRGDHLKPLRQR